MGLFVSLVVTGLVLIVVVTGSIWLLLLKCIVCKLYHSGSIWLLLLVVQFDCCCYLCILTFEPKSQRRIWITLQNKNTIKRYRHHFYFVNVDGSDRNNREWQPGERYGGVAVRDAVVNRWERVGPKGRYGSGTKEGAQRVILGKITRLVFYLIFL
jgi:hypothetical protein